MNRLLRSFLDTCCGVTLVSGIMATVVGLLAGFFFFLSWVEDSFGGNAAFGSFILVVFLAMWAWEYLEG